jgi:hypothetical protein
MRTLAVPWASSASPAVTRASAVASRRPRWTTFPSHTMRPVSRVIGRTYRTWISVVV